MAAHVPAKIPRMALAPIRPGGWQTGDAGFVAPDARRLSLSIDAMIWAAAARDGGRGVSTGIGR